VPTLALRVQQNGRFQGWSALVGASSGYLTVDDRTTRCTTRRDVSRAAEVEPADGRWTDLLPAVLFRPKDCCRCRSRSTWGPSGTALRTRDCRSAFREAERLEPELLQSRFIIHRLQTTFSTNPITGGPWSNLGSGGLEAYIQSESGTNGNNDITLISGSITYARSATCAAAL